MKTLNLKQVRDIFWAEIVTEEEKKEYRVRKTQNDYSTDIRCKFVDFVDYLCKNGNITQKQADRYTL